MNVKGKMMGTSTRQSKTRQELGPILKKKKSVKAVPLVGLS